jgi:hypothetical protein
LLLSCNSGIAVALVPLDEKHANLKKILVIEDWGKGDSNTEKVPSTISYTTPKSEEKSLQWGSDISAKAITMVHTELELDVQDRKGDELEIILHNLDGMKDLNFSHVEYTKGYPEYSPKKPDNIVQDYLERVFQRALVYMIDVYFKEFEFGEDDLQHIPVDIVFTVPVVGFEDLSLLVAADTPRTGHIGRKKLYIALLLGLDSIARHFQS